MDGDLKSHIIKTMDDIMTEATWHRLWQLTLLANGFTVWEAHHAFYVLYGNQPVDLAKDPITDALVLVPIRSGKATAMTSITNTCNGGGF